MENTIEVKESTDYNTFSVPAGVRIDNYNTEEFKHAIRTGYKQLAYLTVSKNLEIITGWDLFIACKETNTPIKYVVSDSLTYEVAKERTDRHQGLPFPRH